MNGIIIFFFGLNMPKYINGEGRIFSCLITGQWAVDNDYILYQALGVQNFALQILNPYNLNLSGKIVKKFLMGQKVIKCPLERMLGI